MKCIDEIPAGELKGKRVLVRAGLDVSLDKSGAVIDLLRVEKSCPTIKYLSEAGARVIILSHIGRDPHLTNEPVARALKKYLPVFYVPDLFGPMAQDAVKAMKDGEILLLENVRLLAEESLELAPEQHSRGIFIKSLSSLGNFFINRRKARRQHKNHGACA